MHCDRQVTAYKDGILCAGQLPELSALGDVLARKLDWADDLRAIRARQLRILQLVAGRYQSVGQVVPAVVLLEAAVRELEETLGLRHPGILALSKRAESMFEALPPQERQEVSTTARLHAQASHCRACTTWCHIWTRTVRRTG